MCNINENPIFPTVEDMIEIILVSIQVIPVYHNKSEFMILLYSLTTLVSYLFEVYDIPLHPFVIEID